MIANSLDGAVCTVLRTDVPVDGTSDQYELFFQAIARQDNRAWAAIYALYTEPIRRWLSLRTDEGDDLVAATFERFWQAMSEEKLRHFSSLAPLVQYLKMCARTARMDHVRSTVQYNREGPLDSCAYNVPSADDVEASVANHLDAGALWRLVEDVLEDERERLVVYCSYVLGLSPREMCMRYAAQFPDVAEIYRLKRNVLGRLRRAPALQALAHSA